ncbi:MAG: hypothetical protein R3F43_01465 [bacterium]
MDRGPRAGDAARRSPAGPRRDAARQPLGLDARPPASPTTWSGRSPRRPPTLSACSATPSTATCRRWWRACRSTRRSSAPRVPAGRPLRPRRPRHPAQPRRAALPRRPQRVGGFLDKRIFGLFVPGEGGVIRRAANALISRVMDVAFGEETRQDLQQFLSLFGTLLGRLNRNQAEVEAFLKTPQVGFMLVTGPAREALDEAFHFALRSEALGLPVAGYVLNRSLATRAHLPMPEAPADAGPTLRAAIAHLTALADGEAPGLGPRRPGRAPARARDHLGAAAAPAGRLGSGGAPPARPRPRPQRGVAVTSRRCSSARSRCAPPGRRT